MITYNLKINFQDEKVLSSDLTFVSGDIGAYKLIFDFYDNSKKVDVSKYTLSVKAKRADGVKIASAGEIENGQAVFIPESNVYAVPGDLYLEVALCDAAGKYITAKIIIATVIEGLGETDLKGAEVSSVYVTLLSNLQSKIDQANQLIEDSIPQKGVDYYTEEEKEEMKDEIIDVLPRYAGRQTDNGEIFNNYSENRASALYSHAEGGVTRSGGKAFRIIGMEVKDAETIFTLNTTNGLNKGDVCTVLLNGLFPECGKIIEITENTVTIDAKITGTYDPTLHETDIEKNVLRATRAFDSDNVGDVYVGSFSHAEGRYARTFGIASHAEGKYTTAEGSYGHAEGYGTTAFYGAHSEGLESKALGFYGHAEGQRTQAKGHTTHAEGLETVAEADYSHAEGAYSKSGGIYSHAEGQQTQTRETGAHAEGIMSVSSGKGSHTEGGYTKATKDFAHAEGSEAQANGIGSHAEGFQTKADGDYSHAEGYKANAKKMASHAEGYETVAESNYSHAEGVRCVAKGDYSHAEGSDTQAIGNISHTEGYFTEAKGAVSHAEGLNTKASGGYQHVQGKYNVPDAEGKYAHIVGGGTGDVDTLRKNIHTVDWSGNAFFDGTVECDGVIMTSPDGAKFKITVDNNGVLLTTKI